MTPVPRVRIGMVNFINTAPLYSVWRRTVHRDDWAITEAPPAVLNRLLSEDRLDLGFVSSHEYAARPDRYHILDGLSISASGKVRSVCLFATVPITELSDTEIVLSPQSQTSNSLVKIVLEDFYGLTPRYVLPFAPAGQGGGDPRQARLAIGDEALRLARGRTYPFVLDLGEAWHCHTGLPFVFALWAIRRDFYANNHDLTREIHREMRRCIDEGREQLRAVSAEVAHLIPMDEASCYEYLRGIEYDLGPKKKESLALFFRHLIKRGEAPEQALPPSYCG